MLQRDTSRGQDINKLKNTIERLQQWVCVSDLRADVAVDTLDDQGVAGRGLLVKLQRQLCWQPGLSSGM